MKPFLSSLRLERVLVNLFPLTCIGLLGCALDQNLLASIDSKITTHTIIKKPPLVTKKNQVLWIGLEPYLGKYKYKNKRPKPLELITFGKLLKIQDSVGLVHKGSQIILEWRKVKLSKPKEYMRQVVGPFASYESAQSMAISLQNNGIKSIISHPKDWELWISKDINIPNAIKSSLVTLTISEEVKPFLKGRSGEILLQGPIQVDAPDGLVWNGGIYSGPFVLKQDAYGSWTLIEKVQLERYLHGVVPYEIGSSAPIAAMSAQSVLARTWALSNLKRFAVDGYHLCSDTQCQVYKDPSRANKKIKAAIANTKGKILTWNGAPIHAVYHASNGGVIASATEAWSIPSLPYLNVKIDSQDSFSNDFVFPLTSEKVFSILQEKINFHGIDHKLFRWRRTFTASQLEEILTLKNLGPSFLPQEVTVLERGPSGRAIALRISGIDTQSAIVLKLDTIRKTLSSLPSTLFVVNQLQDDLWEFVGGGFGHGVGLSQAGAIDLARNGWNEQKILKHYYPGTFYGSLPEAWKAP